VEVLVAKSMSFEAIAAVDWLIKRGRLWERLKSRLGVLSGPRE
jgi:hypothetical protein